MPLPTLPSCTFLSISISRLAFGPANEMIDSRFCKTLADILYAYSLAAVKMPAYAKLLEPAIQYAKSKGG